MHIHARSKREQSQVKQSAVIPRQFSRTASLNSLLNLVPQKLSTQRAGHTEQALRVSAGLLGKAEQNRALEAGQRAPSVQNTEPWARRTESWVHRTGPWMHRTGPWADRAEPWTHGTGPLADRTGSWAHRTEPWAHRTGPWMHRTGPWADRTGPWRPSQHYVNYQSYPSSMPCVYWHNNLKVTGPLTTYTNS